MRSVRAQGARGWLLCTAALLASAAHAQVFVYPRQPPQSRVRSFEYEWHTVDIEVKAPATAKPTEKKPAAKTPPKKRTPSQAPPLPNPIPPPTLGPLPPGHPELPETPTFEGIPQPVPPPPATPPVQTDEEKTPGPKKTPAKKQKPLDWSKAGGVRLYYYTREKKMARYAVASIVRSYQDLAENDFHFVPPKIFPYILYSSYAEFLETNLFPLQPGVLGVTSQTDLTLTLPYLGDDRMFERVSRHEMSHQFTFQKLRTLTKGHSGGLFGGSPVQAMPLWFVEGLAEYYALRGHAPQAEMLARDLVTNPNVKMGYAMLDFYDDRPGSVLWTYKLGEVRCAFLEDTYGKGFIQKILDASVALGGFLGFSSSKAFPHLIQTLTGDDPQTVSQKFSVWLKKRAFKDFLSARQMVTDAHFLPKVHGEPNALSASPDGNLLLYRTMDDTTGQSELFLVDRRAPDSSKRVAIDGRPGLESLHPVFPRNFDLTDHSLVFIGEAVGRDFLFWQTFSHTVKPLPRHGNRGVQTYETSLDLKKRIAYPLAKQGIIAALSPSFSPDGRRVAFIGIGAQGQRDLYIFDPRPNGKFQLTRLTHTIAAEREVSWGPDGIYFLADDTPHRRFNIFRIQPDQPDHAVQVTFEDRDEQDLRAMPDGRLYFVAYDHARANIYEVTSQGIEQRTDVDTGVFGVSPGPGGGVWALYLHSGLQRPALFTHLHLLPGPKAPSEKNHTPTPLVERTLTHSVDYNPFALKNWELGTPFAFLGAGTGGIFGQVYATATDKLHDHGLLLNVSLYGNFDLTDGILLYLDQSQRTTWGVGLAQSLEFRLDESLPEYNLLFDSADRFYGVLGLARYPFDRFAYFETDLQLGGVSYFLPPGSGYFLSDPNLNLVGRDLLHTWQLRNPGPRLQGEVTASYGYNDLVYDGFGAGLSGSTLLLEGSLAVQPQPKYGNVFGSLRLDASQSFAIIGRMHAFVRLGTGISFGGNLAEQFFLSSFDTLRGVHFGDINWLLGREFLYTTAELRIPLNEFIRFFLFNDIEGVVGVDVGGVGNSPKQIWNKRVLDLALGVNFALGPIIIRLQFAKPFNIGAPAGAPSTNYGWVTNFSIGYAGLDGYGLGGKPRSPVLESPHGLP